MTPSELNPVLFDGLVSAFIGAAATIGAIILTIRHDSNARTADRLDESVARTLASFDHAQAQLTNPGVIDQESFRNLISDITMVMTRAKRPAPTLCALLETCAGHITAGVQVAIQPGVPGGSGQLFHTLTCTRILLSTWLTDPELITYGLVDYVWAEQIVEGSTGVGRTTTPTPQLTRGRRLAHRLHLPRRTWYGKH